MAASAQPTSPSLNSQEDLLFIQVVKEHPARHHGAQFDGKGLPAAQIVDESVSEDEPDFLEVKEVSGKVNGDGIGPDHGENKRPFPVAQYVDDAVKECQEQKAPSTGEQDKGAGPKILDDG